MRGEAGAQIYVMNADGSAQTRLTGEGWHGDPRWSPDGRRIAYVKKDAAQTDQVWIMNSDGNGQTQLTDQPGSYKNAPRWSPDGSRIAYVYAYPSSDVWQTEADIWTMNPDGSGKLNVTHSPGRNTDPDWSPDGTQIAFNVWAHQVRREIYVVNADGTGRTNISHGHGEYIEWSP
jgi:TolB protein